LVIISSRRLAVLFNHIWVLLVEEYLTLYAGDTLVRLSKAGYNVYVT